MSPTPIRRSVFFKELIKIRLKEAILNNAVLLKFTFGMRFGDFGSSYPKFSDN